MSPLPPVLESRVLARVPGIEHGYGTRVQSAPGFFASSAAKPTWKQVHGSACVEVRHPAQACGEVDGLYTRSKSPLAVVTADCVPVLLARADGGAVAAIHAGWRGTAAGILTTLWDSLRAQGEQPQEWVAAIGPCAGPCCYEVSEELALQFQRDFAHLGDGIAVPRFRHLDLPAVNAGVLQRIGLGQVEILRYCTICAKGFDGQPAFFSHRRLPGEGRQLSAIHRKL